MATKKKPSAEETVTPPKPEETTEVSKPEETPAEQPTAEKEETVGTGGTATVLDKNGQVFRVYSKDVHGADYAKLAKEFTSDREGFTIR